MITLIRTDSYTKKQIKEQIEEHIFIACLKGRIMKLEELKKQEGQMFPISEEKVLKELQSLIGWSLL